MFNKKAKAEYSNLNLSGLHTSADKISFTKEEVELFHKLRDYIAEYGGEEGSEKFYAEHPEMDPKARKDDVDHDLRAHNRYIYNGVYELHPSVNAQSAEAALAIYNDVCDRYEKRMREVYGFRYDSLKKHAKGDPLVARLLVEDAVRTGKWRELPECLHDQYHAAIRGSV